MTAAANAGTLAGWSAAGATPSKVWTADDCPLHADLHGYEVGIDGAFAVGAFDVNYPGDPPLPMSLRASCACLLAAGAVQPVRVAVQPSIAEMLATVETGLKSITRAMVGPNGRPEWSWLGPHHFDRMLALAATARAQAEAIA